MLKKPLIIFFMRQPTVHVIYTNVYVPNLLHRRLSTLHSVHCTICTLYCVHCTLHIYSELTTHTHTHIRMLHNTICIMLLWFIHTIYTYTLLYYTRLVLYYIIIAIMFPRFHHRSVWKSYVILAVAGCSYIIVVVVNGSSNAFFTVRGMVKLRV